MCAILKAVYGTVISKETKKKRAQFAEFFFFLYFHLVNVRDKICTH